MNKKYQGFHPCEWIVLGMLLTLIFGCCTMSAWIMNKEQARAEARIYATAR